MVDLRSRIADAIKEHPKWKIWAAASGLAAVLFAVCVVVTLNVMGPPQMPELPPASGTIAGMIERSDPANQEEGGSDEDAVQDEGGEAEAAATDASASDAASGQQPETPSQTNAFMAAKLHMSEMPYSHTGMVALLESEGYSHEDALYAANKLGVDWNAKAAEMAAQYVDTMEFTREDLLDQLMYEGFTREQAEAGITAVGM